LVLVEGAVGAAWAPGGTPRVVFAFSAQDEKIVEIEVIMDRDRLEVLDVEILGR
jgi:RNA polymerase sigma-70 factor (ECF subfamily)